MPTSPADQIKSAALNLAIGSFLAGMFLMQGLHFAIRGEALGLLPLMVPVAVAGLILHARRIMRVVAEMK